MNMISIRYRPAKESIKSILTGIVFYFAYFTIFQSLIDSEFPQWQKLGMYLGALVLWGLIHFFIRRRYEHLGYYLKTTDTEYIVHPGRKKETHIPVTETSWVIREYPKTKVLVYEGQEYNIKWNLIHTDDFAWLNNHLKSERGIKPHWLAPSETPRTYASPQEPTSHQTTPH